MARKYIMRSKEEKLAIVRAVLSGTPAQYYENEGIADHHTVMNWVKKYLAEGEAGLEQKKKPGNPLSRYERRKELSYEEQMSFLEYNVLNKRIAETEKAIADAQQSVDSFMREMILSEYGRRLQQLYAQRKSLEDSMSREQVSLRIYGDNIESGKVSTRILLATLEGFQKITDCKVWEITLFPGKNGHKNTYPC